MLSLGVAIFVIGALVVFLSMGGDKNDSAAATTTSTTIQAGTVLIPSAAVPAPSSFTIPEGMQAVAVAMPYVAGLAGYAKAGDRVNVYGNLGEKPGPPIVPPTTKLLLRSVEVLAVTGPGPNATDGKTTYLVALDAAQAEQLIFFGHSETVWLTLVPKDQPVAPATPGRNYQNAF